jgi:hypothetical protein
MQITIDTSHASVSELDALIGCLIELVESRQAVPTVPPAELPRIPTAAEIFASGGVSPGEPATVTTITPPPPPAIDPERIAAAVEAAGPVPPPSVTDAALADVREAVAAADVDASGAAFDPAIHSSARKKNANGLWKKRRGGPASVPPAGQASAPAPAAGHVPPPPPPAIPPPPGTPSPFRALAGKVSAAVESGKLTRERVREICVSVGSPDLMTLNAMPHLIPAADAAFTAAGC